MKIKSKYIIFLFLIINASSLSALELPAAELYVRCFSHMTGQRPLRSDPLLLQVKAGTKTYIAACMELFSKAKLDSTGVVTAKVGNAPDPIAQRVLQTFNNFHNTWFTTLDFGSSVQCDQYDLIDNQEMSYHISNSLFGGAPYSQVITNDQTYAAIRTNPNNVNNTSSRVCGGAFLSNVILLSTVNTVSDWGGKYRVAKWSPYIPQVGALIGIKPMPDEPFIPYVAGLKAAWTADPYENYDQTKPYAQSKSEEIGPNTFEYSASSIKTPSNTKLHKPYGSGIIGTVPYLVLNNGRKESFKADGVVNVARRWSKNVIKDVLCRELPVIRIEDTASAVQPTSGTPFRANASCVRCHNTMDPLAYGIRNLSTARFHENYASDFKNESGYTYNNENPGYVPNPSDPNDPKPKVWGLFKTLFARKYPIRDPQATSFRREVADLRFHLQPPEGKFNFRDIYGVLHSQPFTDLTGPSSLGNYIKDLDDYYVCAAKRYYNFFTGINVPIYDFKDPTMPAPSTDELRHRNNVLKLGTDLKTTQSLELMIRDIISLDIYKQQGFGTQ